MKLRQYPLITLTSVALEDESAIDETSDDVIRFETDPRAFEPGLLVLVSRVWTKPTSKILNVTVTYDAGYVSSSIETDIPDVWAVGYGLDYAEQYRTLPYIGVLEIEDG